MLKSETSLNTKYCFLNEVLFLIHPCPSCSLESTWFTKHRPGVEAPWKILAPIAGTQTHLGGFGFSYFNCEMSCCCFPSTILLVTLSGCFRINGCNLNINWLRSCIPLPADALTPGQPCHRRPLPAGNINEHSMRSHLVLK